MELNLFFLTPLLQCTSIDRCTLFMRVKKKKLLNFSLFFHLKNIFSYFLFLSPASLLSSFFLLIFFFLSLIYTLYFTTASPPLCCRPMPSARCRPSPPIHAANPFCPYLVAFFFFLSCCGLWCGGGCGCVGRSASVGGWVHRLQWIYYLVRNGVDWHRWLWLCG